MLLLPTSMTRSMSGGGFITSADASGTTSSEDAKNDDHSLGPTDREERDPSTRAKAVEPGPVRDALDSSQPSFGERQNRAGHMLGVPPSWDGQEISFGGGVPLERSGHSGCVGRIFDATTAWAVVAADMSRAASAPSSAGVRGAPIGARSSASATRSAGFAWVRCADIRGGYDSGRAKSTTWRSWTRSPYSSTFTPVTTSPSATAPQSPSAFPTRA
jgi:hypothetical protein